jgi:hypothetical protein
MRVKEGHMTEKAISKGSTEAKALKWGFGVICLANLAYYAHSFLTLPGAVRLIAAHDRLALHVIISRITMFLVLGILIWLLVHTYKLIKSVSKGEPFGSRNPRRIRKIAYGALALASVEFLEVSFIFLLFTRHFMGFLYEFMGAPMWTAFFGLSLLVTARVFEEGLRLRQDENLTI